MDGLQRSATSYRRSGSSGLIWDDKLVSGELNRVEKPNKEQQDQEMKEEPRPYRTAKNFSPSMDPPSPKVSTGCALCGLFGKPNGKRKPKSTKRK